MRNMSNILAEYRESKPDPQKFAEDESPVERDNAVAALWPGPFTLRSAKAEQTG
jgi:hypothetical protein